MTIKSLDELRQIKERSRAKTHLRHGEGFHGEETEILVGMATCGIAAGARATMNKLVEELSARDLPVRVIPVGCVGYCKLEPIVVVMEPGNEPVAYANISGDQVPELVESHIVNHKPVAQWRADIDYNRL